MLNHVFRFFVFCWMRLFSLSAGNRVSEFPCASVSKRVSVRNDSYENDFEICMKMKLDAVDSFSYEKVSHLDSF